MRSLDIRISNILEIAEVLEKSIADKVNLQ